MKLKPTQKLVKDETGKFIIVEDHEKARRMKPAGQQFWNPKKRKYGKRASAANPNRTP